MKRIVFAGCGRVFTVYICMAFGLLLSPQSLQALTITGYSSAANDRFESGFPSAPVENTNSAFVGKDLDWSGVGWSTTTYASTSYKGFGMLSPMHFLAAQHYEYASANELTQGIRVLDADGTVHTQTNSSAVSNLGQGLSLSNKGFTNYDLAIGKLDAPVAMPSEIARYGVLDLHDTSIINTSTNYANMAVIVYGRGISTTASPIAGNATTDGGIFQNGIDTKQVYFRIPTSVVQMQSGDSGSPLMAVWNNPNGASELSLLGVNSAVDANYTYISALSTTAAMAAANAVMNPDGYALRVVGNPSATWVGGNGSSAQRDDLFRSGNWSGASIPTDKFVLFDALSTSYKTIDLNAATNLRGLYFKSTGTADDGFTFGGSSTLTLGRGGITNYDSDRQVFNAPLALGDAQYWDGGAGGITVAGTLNTNGKLLETTGSGENLISGLISGTGALAISGGTLELTAGNSYSGNTWAHSGTLKVNNVSGSATGSGTVTVASGATLAGAGIISGATTISGAIAPGNSIGTLTIQNDVTWNAGDFWLFELALAANTLSGAGSGTSTQDMLDITGNFLKGSGSGWAFDFSGTGDLGWYRLIDWSTDTTFAAEDFLASNLANDYTGSFSMDSGSLYLQVIPEPVSMVLLGPGLLMVFGYRGWRRQGSGIFGLKAPQAVPQERVEDDCPEPLLCWHDWMLRQQWKVEGIQNRYDRCTDQFWTRVARAEKRFQVWRMRRRAG